MSFLQGPIFTTLWCTSRFVREASMNHTPSAIPWHSVDGPCGLLKSKAEPFIHKRPDFQDYILGRGWPASFNNWLGNPTTLLNFSPSPSSSWNPYATSSAVQGRIPSSTGDWTAIRPLAPDDPDPPPLHVGRIMSNTGGKGELGGSVGESTRFPPARANASCRSSSCRASLNPPLMDATFDGCLADKAPWSRIADDVVPSAATCSDGTPTVSWSWRTHVEKILCSSPGQWRPRVHGRIWWCSRPAASWSRQASFYVLTWTL